MLPDYAHKMFDDKRIVYCLLMEALAMGTVEVRAPAPHSPIY
jgi:hypothetical protein